MTDRIRTLGAILAAAALTSAPLLAQTPSTLPWKIGDVFAGVGRFDVRPGEYLVLSPQGDPKVPAQTLVDPLAGETGVTTGCAVGTPAFGNALFATSFYNRTLTRFALHSGAASVAASVAHPGVEAIESIVFDDQGHYYVGGLPPQAASVYDPPPPLAYIFKFDATHALVATYEVPNERRGVDWLDLGSDQTTLYYTSEGTAIHVFNPTRPPADRYRRIQLTEGGVNLEGRLYAMRALPPLPGDPALAPSGFLVAGNGGVLRVAPDGRVIQRYWVPGLSGQYFALNITPDGQSFWTATIQIDPDWADFCPGGSEYQKKYADRCRPEPPAGQLVRFHIPTGIVTAGPIGTGAPNISGVCVMREYTAGINTCYQTDPDGDAVLVDGQPVVVACRVHEICGNATDEDGDGLADAQDRDCASPLAPVLSVPADQEDTEGQTIAPLQMVASGGRGPLQFSAAGLPQGLSISPTTGVISGTLSWLAGAGLPYPIKVYATDGVERAEVRFQWKVHEMNGPPSLEPATIAVPVGVPFTLPLATFDPDYDTVRITMTGAPAWLQLSGLAEPPSYEVALSGTPPAAGRYEVQLCASDLASVAVDHAPVCRVAAIVATSEPPNRAPVCSGGSPARPIWPPNHQFVAVTIDGVTDPDGDPVAIAVTGIQQDEPVTGPGAGNTSPDGRIDGATAWVRAERVAVKASPGEGRVYEVFYTATDGRASCAGSVLVGIPHDQGDAGKAGQRLPVDSGLRWNAVTGARVR
jgi:hypothetical protein